jgi:hypothetical protein
VEYIVGVTLALFFCAAVALGGHGVMDTFHQHLVHNSGVPQAWPGFCASFDVTAAVIVAWVMLVRARGVGQQQADTP